MVWKTIKKNKSTSGIVATILASIFAMAIWYLLSWGYSNFMGSEIYSDGEKLLTILIFACIGSTLGTFIILFIELKETKNDILEKIKNENQKESKKNFKGYS